jgi:hypothetical protein
MRPAFNYLFTDISLSALSEKEKMCGVMLRDKKDKSSRYRLL